MSQKTFGKQLTVVDTKSRVKMHKSGKNWVRTVMSHFNLLKRLKGEQLLKQMCVFKMLKKKTDYLQEI